MRFGNIVALSCITISFLFAVLTHHWWVLLGIVAAVWLGSRTPWGRSQHTD
jgi:hypothetical protein